MKKHGEGSSVVTRRTVLAPVTSAEVLTFLGKDGFPCRSFWNCRVSGEGRLHGALGGALSGALSQRGAYWDLRDQPGALTW